MIEYFSEDIDFPDIDTKLISTWVEDVIMDYSRQLGEIAYIFCSDDYILQVNNDYLKHDYFTDVITFDYCEDNRVSGDLFISLQTVKSNAEKYDQDYALELHRVIIHGILHLCGLKDKTEKDALMMRDAEDKALQKLNHEF